MKCDGGNDVNAVFLSRGVYPDTVSGEHSTARCGCRISGDSPIMTVCQSSYMGRGPSCNSKFSSTEGPPVGGGWRNGWLPSLHHDLPDQHLRPFLHRPIRSQHGDGSLFQQHYSIVYGDRSQGGCGNQSKVSIGTWNMVYVPNCN